MAVAYSEVRQRPFDIIDYGVSEDVTPLVPGEGGSIPNLTLSARAIETGPLSKRNVAALNGSLRLIDTTQMPGIFKGRGVFLGKNATTRTADGELTVTASSILEAFNQEIIAEALFDPATTVGSAFRYYASLVGIPETGINVDSDYDLLPFVAPRWEGNAWTYLMDFCVAVGCELSMRADIITLHAPRLRTLISENVEQAEVSTAAPTVADRIEVINYNTERSLGRVVYTATGTFSVEGGGITEAVLDYDNANLSKINYPEARQYITAVETGESVGQYVVYDSENTLVDPAWWRSAGGRITAEIGKEPGTIDLTIFGALGSGQFTQNYVGPFTIGEYKDGTLGPGLVLTGDGVFTNPVPVPVYTGSPAARTEAAPDTVDNVFLSTHDLAYQRGLSAAMRAGGLDVELSAFMPFDLTIKDGQEFGVIPGSRVQIKDNIFRITTVSYSLDGIEFSAKSDMLFSDVFDVYGDTFDEVNLRYEGLSFNDYNAVWPVGTTFNYVSLYNFPTFDDVDNVYEGISFLEQSVYPYIKAPIYVGIPSTMAEVDAKFIGKTFADFDKSMPPGTTFRVLNRELR